MLQFRDGTLTSTPLIPQPTTAVFAVAGLRAFRKHFGSDRYSTGKLGAIARLAGVRPEQWMSG